MTFILAQSRLSYDHFGAFPILQTEATEQAPTGIVGDAAGLAEGGLGTFTMGEELQVVDVKVEVL